LTSNIEVEFTTEDVEIVKAYSITTLDGEVTNDYVEEAVPTSSEESVDDIVLYTLDVNGVDGIDKSMWRTLTVHSISEEAVFDYNNIDGNVPVMVICYTEDGTMTYTTVDDFGVKIECEETDSSVLEKENDGLVYEVMTMTTESTDEDSEVVMFDIVEFDNEMVHD
jgi:hypothetical protein